MSSRYTETEKWSDPWFQNLPHGSKLLFLYLCDQCNIAGFYEVNKRELCFHLGIEEKQYEGAIKALGRGVKEADGWLWLKNFLKHQRNNDLNPENAAHRGILRLLREQLQRFKGIKEFDDMVGATKGLASPTVMYCNVKKEEGVQGKKQSKVPEMGSDEYFDYLKSNPAYAQHDVRTEYHKCLAYFPGQRVSHKRVLNWLNRATPSVNSVNGNHAPKLQTAAEYRAEMDRLAREEEANAR